MTTTVFFGSRHVDLDDRDLIGEGGEGRVYRVKNNVNANVDLAVKIFTTPDTARESKLRAFPSQLPPHVIAPIELCSSDAAPNSTVIGYSMRVLDSAVDIAKLAQRRWREAARVDGNDVVGVFRDLRETIVKLHARGIVVGDLNDGNVVLTASSSPTQPWSSWMIDTDSMQLSAQHPCVVAHERFLDPQLYNVDLRTTPALSEKSDWYALAVMLFGSLLYVHPFGGAHPSHPTMLRRAEARVSVLRSDVKLPSAAIRSDVLPDDAIAWFTRVFERDVREPLPQSLLETRFVRCSCGGEHARASCPICSTRVHVAPIVRARGQVRSTRVFKASNRGRIVTAVMQNGLKHAHEEGGALIREDGTVVVRCGAYLEDPDRVVCVSGTSTWIGANRRFDRFVGDRLVSSTPIGVAFSADAGVEGLVSVQGDWLVREESGTRVGQVLEGQTHVRVGGTIGFAFYRAGAVTVAFVFDPRRGMLRQIASFPHLSGKLVGWSAVFDDANAQVLVSFAMESMGHRSYAVHLINARGEILATESSSSSPIAQSLTGRAIANGNVILATADDGLMLMKIDRSARAFVPARLFSEAKDMASPDDDLLVGPGGSLFVVSHDEITHLCFTGK